NVLNLRHLAHLLGTDRPFYGLQARGLYGDQAPHDTFEDMARDYIKELRTIQPHGPYLLGGFSGGGITAYEMAQQLLAEGEETALLVMLDSNLPGGPVMTRADKLRVHAQRLRRKGPRYLYDAVENHLRWRREQAAARAGQGDAGQKPYELQNAAIEAAFRTAFARYRPKPYPGKIELFRPRLDKAYDLGNGRVLDHNLQFVFHDNGWGQHVPAIDVHEVPGTHDSMVLEPNVRVMAARLRACIVAAENGIATSGDAEGGRVPAAAAATASRVREEAAVS
ncbi:MAG TPA: alpha/beta fold hydrolase, partial [Burkholderiales bacterium]|nr:alpha/beta fold hydrolase [Burkholderiales bacterium]